MTLSKYKDIYLNLKAYEALGRPERIQFFYDTARSRIGLRKSLHEDNNAFPVKKEPGSGSAPRSTRLISATTTASDPIEPSNSPTSPSTPTASWSST